MKVVILCGGLGTRMREETEYRPKPMVDVGGHPILWHIMKIYAHFGFTEFVLCLGYKGDVIKEYFLNYHAMNNDFTVELGGHGSYVFHNAHEEQDFKVTLADTGAETMTGGRLARVRKYVPDETFMLTYGDGLANVNIAELVKFHKAHGKLATVTGVRPVSRFGIMETSPSDCVEQFAEKPVQAGWASAGFFVLSQKVFDYIEGGDSCVFEQKPLERLVAERQLMRFPHDDFFFAMDTYREYKHLNDLWSSQKAPWKVWT